jgi:hypothetical protein
MVMNHHLYAEAVAWRREGKSYNEIQKRFGIPKSTLSGWLRDIPLSQKAIERLKSRVAEGTLNGLVKRNRLQTVLAQKRAAEIRKKAAVEIKNLGLNDRYLAGIVMYWAEGYKRIKTRAGKEVTNHPISFTNSDPLMIRIFVDFLKIEMGIPTEKIKAHIRLFSHIDPDAAIKHWSSKSGLPPQNFLKSSVVVSGASKRIRPFDRLPFGTVQIVVADTPQFYRLMGWLDGVKNGLRKAAKTAKV